jgi:hypothetical protein
MRRTPTKKWKVDDVLVHEWGEAVPLYVDGETGEFWFEYPLGSGHQYAGHSRSRMARAIHECVVQHHNLEWVPLIAVKVMAPGHGHTGPTPFVGFASLFRYERATIELRVPRCWRGGSKAGQLKDLRRALQEPDVEWRWTTRINTEERVWPGDDEPLRGRLSEYGCRIFPYSEDMWIRLVAIHDACCEMHANLATLLSGSTDDIVERVMLMQPGVLLLAERADP